jgi:hypothetical protein
MFGFKKKQQEVKVKIKNLEPPKGWYVQNAAQNPLHMLWDVVLVSFDDISNQVDSPRYHISTESDSYNQALQECINKIK